MLSNGDVIGRDWKTGDLLRGAFASQSEHLKPKMFRNLGKKP
jgi:hypothetical protein